MRDVDRDALLALGREAVEQQREVELAVDRAVATRVGLERGETRADDRVTEAAMEDRKKEGYF